MAVVAQPKNYIESNPGVSSEFKFLSFVHAFRHFPWSVSTHPEVNVHVPVKAPLTERSHPIYGL